MDRLVLKKQYMSYQAKKSRLPSAYQEVEYIEGTGTQFIDTGIIATLTSKIELDVQCVGTPSSGLSNYTNGTNWYAMGFDHDGAYHYIFSVAGNGVRTIRVSDLTALKQRIILKLDTKNGKYGYNDTLIDFVPYGIDDALTQTIFAKKGGASTYVQICQEKVFEYKYFENEFVVNDLVPCYRISDNMIGLYDIVGNQFYTNQGSGTFLKGANV